MYESNGHEEIETNYYNVYLINDEYHSKCVMQGWTHWPLKKQDSDNMSNTSNDFERLKH